VQGGFGKNQGFGRKLGFLYPWHRNLYNCLKSKALLARHLFNENGEELVRNLTRWWTSSKPSVLPTFGTSLHPLNIMLVLEAPWITYFLSWKVLMTTSKIIVSLDKWLGKRSFCLKCYSMGQEVGLICWSACNLVVICRIVSWCLIMLSMFKNGPSWLVMFMTRCTTKCSPL
jgi:hypothetical protein